MTFDFVLLRSTLFPAPNSHPTPHPAPDASSVSAGPWRSWGQDAACCLCLQLFLHLCLAVFSLPGREDGLGVSTVGARPEPGRSDDGKPQDRFLEDTVSSYLSRSHDVRFLCCCPRCPIVDVISFARAVPKRGERLSRGSEPDSQQANRPAGADR